MTITPTETPRLANGAERSVYQALVDQLEPNDLVIPGQRVTDHLKDHEVDFVVAIEGAGIVCLEVKGGEVWHDGDGWCQTPRRPAEHKIEPVRQAREACYALRDFIEKRPALDAGPAALGPRRRPSRTPNCPTDFALPECPRWKVIDRNDLPTSSTSSTTCSSRQETRPPAAHRGGHRTAHNCVERQGITATRRRGPGAGQRGRRRRADRTPGGHPRRHPSAPPRRGARRRGQRQDVPGDGAGPPARAARASGSRWSATRTAWRPTWNASPRHGRAANSPPTSASSTRSAVQWGAPEGPDESMRNEETVRFWEHDLPLQMADLAAQLDPGHRFDSVVIDEAQDFADAWWDPLLAALKDDETGGIYVFSDEGQRVFDRHGSPPVPLVPLILDHNLRNTRQIANAFQPLVDHPMRFLGGDGPAVKFVACAPDDAMDVGDDQVDLLLEDGWRPEDVALLTTGSRHPEQIERQAGGQRRVLGQLLGHRPGVLRPRAGLQGTRAPRGRARGQRGGRVRAVPRTAVRRIVQGP